MSRGYAVVLTSLLAAGILTATLYFFKLLPEQLNEILWHAKEDVLLSLSALFTLPLALALAATLLLEKAIPAQPSQRVFSLAFVQDFVWAIYEAALHALVILTFVAGMQKAYRDHFSYLTIDAISAWPEWMRFIFGALLLDFAFWLQHYLMHKVPWLWQLHTVHHSQEQLNFFTNKRYHVLEYIIRHAVVVIPFLILDVNAPTIIVYSIFLDLYTNFYHGNIKTNLGVLKYILVTPQYHRVHHSKFPQHRDRNFGSIYTFWDFIFGTGYRGFSEYPATGINDPAFPQACRSTAILIPLMPVIHMIYPVSGIWRSIARLGRPAAGVRKTRRPRPRPARS